MVKQFAIGTAISLMNISIHAVWTIVLDRAVQRYWGEQVHERFTRDRFLLMICVGTALIVAHFIEVLVWALFYDVANVAPPGIDPVYFALVHYTTIGHGDIAAPEEWALIGPITGTNGLLLFGWSTAVIFEVVRTTIPGLRK
jgi:hypothetical protein